MQTHVHILASVPKPEALDAAKLVFKTLRVGFPTAEIWVQGNGLDVEAAGEIMAQVKSLTGTAHYTWSRAMVPHDQWLERLICEAPGTTPTWVCDTDMVFFGPVEQFKPEYASLAGRFEPAFHEEFTDTVHVERLHTCLLHFLPGQLRAAMREVTGRWPTYPPFFRTSQTALIRQTFVPRRKEKTLFYDTAAGLWHAGIGQAFPPDIDAAFEHLH